MRLFALIVGLFLTGIIFSVRTPHVYAQATQNQKQEVKKSYKYVKVMPGDNLSKIAKRNKTTYQRLFFANKKVLNPDLIYPGQKIRIPSKNEQLKKRTIKTAVEAVISYTQRPKHSQVASSIATVKGSITNAGVWDRLASCESGGNWSINTGNGYYGGLQFTLGTWRSVGGKGYPHQNSRSEQIKRGKILQARSGWGQWPACTSKLGLR